MSITGMQWLIIWAYYRLGSPTAEVNFGAQPTVAPAGVGQADGEGLLDSGSCGFRTYPNPDGPSHFACIVYDHQTGNIHHVHQVVNLPGAKAPSRDEMEKHALRHTPKGAPAGLAVLLVPSDQVERGESYRVDHEQQALVVEQEPTLLAIAEAASAPRRSSVSVSLDA